MKDQIALLVAGLLVAGSAAAYFRFFGEAGIWIIVCISMTTLMVDNRNLRREVKKLKGQQQQAEQGTGI
jgi:hypothetical protein